MSRFIQIHALASYPGTLLNRDDAGFAKRLPFGGATRTRVSSQCLKRHWRTYEGADGLRGLSMPMSVRSRYAFLYKVYAPLVKEGMPEVATLFVVNALMSTVLSGKVKFVESFDPEKVLKSSQIVVLGMPELDYLKALASEMLHGLQEKLPTLWAMSLPEDKDAKFAAKDYKDELGAIEAWIKGDKELAKNLEGLKLGSGLDAALFGRMVTSDVLSRGDAAVHVAHAITVHAEASESDYFSAIDELLREDRDGELGSGHINSTELTSGLFYLYVVVDLPLLISNLESVAAADWKGADKQLASEVISRLLTMIATVSPGAKKGSTAPYSNAEMVFVELGDAQPRTLANAFLKPVQESPDLRANTYAAMSDYYKDWSQMYGATQRCLLSGMGDLDALAQRTGAARSSLPELIKACAQLILNGEG